MKTGLGSLLRSWGELAGKIGFFLLLVAGSAVIGIAIAWPLWYFATKARDLYTIFALSLAGAGVVYLIVRAIVRGRGARREKTGRSPLSAILFLVQLVVFLAGLYFVAVLAFHGILVFAIPLFLAWLGLLVLLGLGRRAAKAWRHGGIVPKIRKE